jgi:protoporphyrin/coproporphyrin ferrochelatase
MTSSLILVNLGTTRTPTPEGVRDFLREFLGDPMVVDWPGWVWRPILKGVVLPLRPRRVARLYASIWTEEGAPLRAGTERIAAQVRDLVDPETEVHVAFRYGEPGLARTVEEAAKEGPVTVVSLFPHRTASTTGTIDDLVRRTVDAAGHMDPERIRVLHPEPDDPGFIEALAARWEEALETSGTEPEHVVLSYHGIPTRHDRREDGMYSEGCARTTRAFLARIGWPAARATTAFQSRFGPEPWLRPATDDTLEALARGGVRTLAVVTPGFITEGLETVEEIGEEGKELFLKAGGRTLVRVGCVEDHPAFVESLVRLARR